MTPTIRYASPADADTISDLFGQLGHPAGPEAVAARLERFAQAGEEALVAEVDGAVVGVTALSVTVHVSDLVLERRTPMWWWVGFGLSAGLLGLFVVALGWLFIRGVGIWGIDWPVAWGFAIGNYVWWVGMASGGTLISALFFLTRSEWRSATSRLAETMTLFAAACAGIYPILHLGRPWLFYWLFPFPNTMTLWPQFRSPLLWDFFAILTYVLSSILFWYFEPR